MSVRRFTSALDRPRGASPTFQAMTAAVQLHIVQDSREQSPFRFEGFPVAVEVGTLETGDYALHGFERRVSVERKSLQDLIGCLSTDRKRFEAELARLRGFDAAAVVVESTQAVLRLGHYRAQMDAAAAWQSVLAFMQRFKVPFIFCDSRADAEKVTFDLLRHFARDRWREFQALSPAATIAPRKPEAQGPGDEPHARPNAPKSRPEANPCRSPRLPDMTGPTKAQVLFRGDRSVVPAPEGRVLPPENMENGMTSMTGLTG